MDGLPAPHTALFWVHFVGSLGGIAVYALAVLTFWRFATKSLYRPTCIALCWVFGSLGLLLTAHTIAQLVAGLEAFLQVVDIGVRVLIGVAMVTAWADTRRKPFGPSGK